MQIITNDRYASVMLKKENGIPNATAIANQLRTLLRGSFIRITVFQGSIAIKTTPTKYRRLVDEVRAFFGETQ
jgi:hypothetical protein